jgi:hypothetical protein
MVSLLYSGRLGNNMIQYFAAYMLAKKKNLFLNVQPVTSENFGSYFEIRPLQTERLGSNKIEVTDNNFMEILESKEELNHYYLNGFFQKKELLEKHEKEIKSFMNLNYDPEITKDLVMVHYRIGDTLNDRRMLPIEYYFESLDLLNFSGGYIASDSLEHQFCKNLIKKYNLIPVTGLSPLQAIDFGKNFNNIVTSESTFSWWMAFLSKAENVIYNRRDHFRWYGDIFFNRWKQLSWDYEPGIVYDRLKLREYKPLRLESPTL